MLGAAGGMDGDANDVLEHRQWLFSPPQVFNGAGNYDWRYGRAARLGGTLDIFITPGIAIKSSPVLRQHPSGHRDRPARFWCAPFFAPERPRMFASLWDPGTRIPRTFFGAPQTSPGKPCGSSLDAGSFSVQLLGLATRANAGGRQVSAVACKRTGPRLSDGSGGGDCGMGPHYERRPASADVIRRH